MSDSLNSLSKESVELISKLTVVLKALLQIEQSVFGFNTSLVDELKNAIEDILDGNSVEEGFTLAKYIRRIANIVSYGSTIQLRPALTKELLDSFMLEDSGLPLRGRHSEVTDWIASKLIDKMNNNYTEAYKTAYEDGLYDSQINNLYKRFLKVPLAARISILKRLGIEIDDIDWSNKKSTLMSFNRIVSDDLLDQLVSILEEYDNIIIPGPWVK